MVLAINEIVPEVIQSLTILDEKGEAVPVGSLLGEKPTVLVFLRHFGCIACSEHLTAWKPRFAEFERLGIRVVLIGNGTTDHLKGFIERFGLEGEPVQAFTDPTLKLHRALSLKHSISSTMGPWSIKNALRAVSHGHWQTSVEGDPLQQGGLIIIDSDKRIQFIHCEKGVGDHVDVSDVLEAAAQLIVIQNEEIL